MESKNREAVIEGSIALTVTHRSKGITRIADDEDFKALKIEVKRVNPKRLNTYLAK